MATGVGRRSPEERQALLKQALLSRPDGAACQACLERLDDYIAAQLAAQDYVARFPAVATHLDACLECAGAYGRLYELELVAAADSLPQPARLPEPDLSFLSPKTAAALAERLRAAFRRAGDRLTLQFSADLLPLLRPAPALIPVRAPADHVRYGQVLLALAPDPELRPDLPVSLTAYRDAHRPEACLVEVTVEPPGRSWPDQAGIAVTLTVAGEPRSAATDAWGLAAFEGVPVAHLAQMTVEVEV